MLAKQPQVESTGHRRSSDVAEFICPVRVIRRAERLDAQINFRQLEPDRLEVEVPGEFRELFELWSQTDVILRRALSDLVVCQQIGEGLRLGQMVEIDNGDALETKELRRFIAPVPGDNLVAFVDQNGRVEAECIDALRDRRHLDPAMLARIARIRAQGADRNERQFSDASGAFGPSFISSIPCAIVVSIAQGRPDVAIRFVRRRGASG